MSISATRFSTFLYRRRWLLFALSLVSWVFALQIVSGLQVSNSLDVWYPDDAVVLQQYADFKTEFGNDEVVLLTITTEDGFAEQRGLELLESVADQLYEIDGVATVTSLATVPASMRSARDRLLSHDGKTAALVIQMMAGDQFEQTRPQVLSDIHAVADTMGLQAHYAGNGVIYEALNHASTVGSAELLVFAHILMFFVLLAFFKRLLPVLVTLLAVGMATSWMMAVYVVMGRPLNMVTMALPTLVLVMGIANCAHLLRSVARRTKTQNHTAAVIDGLADPLWPCVVSSLTTAAGFLSLLSSPLPVVADLGLFGALGMIFALIASLVVVSFFSAWPAAIPRLGARGLNSISTYLGARAIRAPRATVAVFAVLAVISIVGCLQLQADTDSIGYLPEQHPVRVDSRFIEEQIGNYSPVDFTIHSKGGVSDSRLLDALQQWQIHSTDIHGVGWSWSVVDLLGIEKDVAPSSLGNDELDRRLRKLESFSPSALRSMVGEDGTLRVTFGGPMQAASGARTLIEDITAVAAFPAEVSVSAAGYIPLYTHIIDEIVSSQVRGFAVAIPLIVLLLGLSLRSWAATLIAIPANVLPVVATLGLMALLGIPLDIATATIGTVVLGLVVDDSVHLLHGARRASGSQRPTVAGIKSAISESGGTLLLTSIALVAGFLVFGFADILSIRWFGLLAAFAMTFAILADLLLLPAFCVLYERYSTPREVS